MSASFFDNNKDFWLKLRLDRVQGSPVPKIRLEKLKELSYEALLREAVGLTRELEEPSPGESTDSYTATFTYEDVDGDQILIASTEELIQAVQEFGSEGFLHVTARFKPKQSSVVAPLAPLTPPTKVPSVASTTPSCSPKPVSPAKTKKRTVVAPSTGIKAPVVPSPVAFMPPSSVVSPAKTKKSTVVAPSTGIKAPVVASPVAFMPPSAAVTQSIPSPVASMPPSAAVTQSIPSPVASMPPSAAVTQSGSTRCNKPRLDYAAIDSGATVSFNAEESDSPVAIKQEEEPPKKRRRQGLTFGELGGTMTVSDRILYGLMELHALGVRQPLKTQVSNTADYSNARSPGFTKQLLSLKKNGIIEYRSGGRLSLTAQGLQKLPFKVEQPRDNADAQARLLKILALGSKKGKKGVQGTKAEQILGLLRDGKVHEKEKVAEALGYTNVRSPGFAKVLSKMSGLELIYYPRGTNKPSVQLTDIAFPFGRPSAASLPSPSASTPQSAPAPTLSTPKKAPEKKKSSVPVVTPNRGNAAPIPPRVVSMPLASTMTGSQEQEGRYGKRKARVDYAALNGGKGMPVVTPNRGNAAPIPP